MRRTELAVNAATVLKALRQAGVKRKAPRGGGQAASGGGGVQALWLSGRTSTAGAGAALSELPDADRMGVGGGPVRATGKARSTAAVQPLGDGECVLLRGAQRLFHGGCCRTSFHPGRMCIAPSGAGLREASSSRCMIGLRELWRSREERAPEPSAAVLDAQSTRSSPQGGPSGYDAGKKVKGRKRNLVVDTLGLLLMVSVVPANVQDRDSADQVVGEAIDKYPSLEKLYVDSGYSGTCAVQLKQEHQIDVEVVRHPANRNVGRWVNPDQGELFSQCWRTARASWCCRNGG